MRDLLAEKIREKVKESYEAIAREFDMTRKVAWPEFDHFLAYIRKGARVLDLGCGNGRLYDVLKSKQVQYLGVDHNSALLEAARKNFPEASFQLADMVELPLESGAFDAVFSIASFHHLPGKKMMKKSAHEMHRVLKEDGVLVLTVWNLFQFKYIGALMRAVASCLLHLGFKASWNDLWIKWGGYPKRRYYHAFLPSELKAYFPSDLWQIEELYFTRKGNRVGFWRSFNLILIARKK